MPTVLCVDDFTKVFVRRHRAAARRRVRSLAAADRATALEFAADTPMDAVILNCHREPDNSALVTALRILQPRVAVIMFSGYCGIPCNQLKLADACFQKGEASTSLMPILRSMLCQSRYGLGRVIPA